MKIKKLRCVLGMLGLSTTLALTGCNSSNSVEELEIALEALQDESDSLTKETDFEQVELKNSDTPKTKESVSEEIQEQKEEENTVLNYLEKKEVIAKLKEKLGSSFTYTGKGSQCSICISNIDNNLDFKDEFYSDLNLILSGDNISCSLELNGLGNEIDFSKLDLTHVNKLFLYSCQEDFDYDIFSNYTYDALTFYSIPFEKIQKIIENGTTNSTVVDYTNYNNLSDGGDFVRFLVDNNIAIGQLIVTEDDSRQQDIYELLGQLNVEEIVFYEHGISYDSKKTKLDLNLTLNDRIQSITFSLGGRELGDIQISSNVTDLFVYCLSVNITENTKFNFPNDAYLHVFGNYTDMNAFRDLRNVTRFSYSNSDTYESVYYNSYLQNDFDEFLEEIEETNGKVLAK